MVTRFLFPHYCKKIGWLLLVPAFICSLIFFSPSLREHLEVESSMKITWGALISDSGIFSSNINKEESSEGFVWFSLVRNSMFNELTAVLAIVSCMLIAFSKTKQEDEFILKIRLESLLRATYLNYGILLLAILFVFDMPFIYVLIWNMMTTLIFFIIDFNWQLYKVRKNPSYD